MRISLWNSSDEVRLFRTPDAIRSRFRTFDWQTSGLLLDSRWHTVALRNQFRTRGGFAYSAVGNRPVFRRCFLTGRGAFVFRGARSSASDGFLSVAWSGPQIVQCAGRRVEFAQEV